MKNFIKENWFKIVITIIAIILVGSILNKPSGGKDIEVKESFLSTDISTAKEITCTFPQTIRSVYLNNEIIHSLPIKENEPMINTFSKLDEPTIGQMSYIDSTRTITNTPIVKIIDDDEKYAYLVGGTENHTTVYYIYKKLGVATYSKSVSLLGIPSISGGMGSCVGY